MSPWLKHTARTLFVLVALTVVYCLLNWGMGIKATAEYRDRDFAAAASTSDAHAKLTVLERHKPHFNEGTALAASGDLAAACTELERALELTSAKDECAVRINLAYVVELQGDEAKAGAAAPTPEAQKFYAHAQKVLEGAPPECQPQGSSEKQQSDDAQERLEQKQESGGDGDQPGDPKDPGGDADDPDGKGKSDSDAKREEIAKRGEEGTKRQQQSEEGYGSGSDAPRAKKPW